MTKVRLVDGTIINAKDVPLENGIFSIVTEEKTVEELAEIFSNKDNISLITFLTEGGTESGYLTGFTSFAGINYDADGVKTVRLFQPVDDLESRISTAAGEANKALDLSNGAYAKATLANDTSATAMNKVNDVELQNAVLAETIDSILTDVIPSLVVVEPEEEVVE